RRVYCEALAAEGRPSEELPADELALEIPSTGGVVRVDLSRLHAELQRCRGDEERTRRFGDFLEATLEALRSAEGSTESPTRDQVVPAVKGRHWVDGLPANDIA